MVSVAGEERQLHWKRRCCQITLELLEPQCHTGAYNEPMHGDDADYQPQVCSYWASDTHTWGSLHRLNCANVLLAWSSNMLPDHLCLVSGWLLDRSSDIGAPIKWGSSPDRESGSDLPGQIIYLHAVSVSTAIRSTQTGILALSQRRTDRAVWVEHMTLAA